MKDLTLTDAINIVERRHVQEPELQAAKDFFDVHLKEIGAEEFEKRAEFHYYLLTIMLSQHLLYENLHVRKHYDEMIFNFRKQELILLTEFKSFKNTDRSIIAIQLRSLSKIFEHYCNSLELAYKRLGFSEAEERVYVVKMQCRKMHAYFTKNTRNWLFYALFELTSNFGLSFYRWGSTLMVIIFSFAVSFYVIDLFSVEKIIKDATSFNFDYVYYSVVTFCTLGFGDILPHTTLQRVVACIEVVTGYTMLGMFLNLIQKRM
ncbi:MAG: potassium channel family protein [Candidatus Gracilibacteria bacterium]